jgi:acyl dehydratase
MNTTQDIQDWYYEDCAEGQVFSGGPLDVTADDIVAFARRFDPQVFHTDAEAAKDSAFGELVASGWHTTAMTMRLMVDNLPKMPGGMVGRRIETIDWPRPVRPGDRLRMTAEVLSLRTTRNPEKGLMRLRTVTVNQHGETVLQMEALIFIPRRPTEA